MVTRRDPEKHKQQVRSANRARYRAVQALIERHQPEFDLLYSQEAATEGVEPKPRRGLDAVALQGQIKQLEARLAQITKDDKTSA